MENNPIYITPFSLGYNFTVMQPVSYYTLKEGLKPCLEAQELFNDSNYLMGSGQYLSFSGSYMLIIRQSDSFTIKLKTNNSLQIYYYDKVKNLYTYIQDHYLFSSTFKEEREEGINKLRAFFDEIVKLQVQHPTSFFFSERDLYYNADILNPHNYYLAAESSRIMLYVPNFKKPNSLSKNMQIVLKKSGEIIGHIAFALNDSCKDNFAYDGNVEYAIKPLFQGNGYATEALRLVKELVFEYSDEVNKELYIAIDPENKASIKVAEKNGGVRFYDGEVPRNHELYIYNHLKKVIVYKI